MTEPWRTVSCPEEAGVSSKGLLAYLDAVKDSGLEHHSILVLRHGALACKMNFAPYDDQTPHMLFSLSKSFTSAAAGFAVQEGLLKWDDRVLDILPEDAPEDPSDELKAVTLHHLLCMGSGLKPESDEVGGEHWGKAILACGCDHAPGTHFHYNSHGTYLVSKMVQKAAGMNIRDYLMPRLFAPLGIPEPEWDMCPEGVCMGGWGLHLSSDSILRFGLCLLQKGMWQGRQVLPEKWLEKATKAQIDNANGVPDPDNEWAQGYGYQFWRTRGNRYRGDGMYGQICMISPDLDMAVAVTAGIEDMGKEMQLLHEYLFPAADMAPGTAAEQAALKARLAALAYPWPEDDGTGGDVSGVYENDDMTLEIGDKDGDMEWRMRWKDGGYSECVFKKGAPFKSRDGMRMGAYGWQKGELRVLGRALNAPFTLHGACIFEGNQMRLTLRGPGFTQEPCVLAKRA